MSRYEEARKTYKDLYGVDTEAALKRLATVSVSLHCWQGDDVVGFDSREALSGGIQATGNYPGKARTPEELMADLEEVLWICPGKYKLNLHASYAVFKNGVFHDRNQIEPEDFEAWVSFAKKHNLGLDFNPTFFSHSMVRDNLTLTSPDPKVQGFWIEHGKRCVRISEYFAQQTGMPVLMNIWIPDGYKNNPGDRLGPRRRYLEAVDAIITEPHDPSKVFVSLESKTFGIGLESYTAGSAEFTLNYMCNRHLTPLMDNGHYHPTEVVSDKISSLLLFHDRIGLHLTHPVRWDSDHVVLYDDELREMMKEVVRCDALDRVFLATDFFDASINRISAWCTGVRNVQKALLYALLEPSEMLRELQDKGDFTSLMVIQEEQKTAPLCDVWNEYLDREGKPRDYLTEVKRYEREVLEKR